ncbi:MAG: hypothetical protein BYD32DRAFT_438595 [Podila humilis]|nr:MAG: hypothetical protein BYD32DRAFT_438595 [Podila humilis]
MTYSPSGLQIASGGSDETVQLWDVDLGQCLAVVEDRHGEIRRIVWNATLNGTYFSTCCANFIHMWKFIEEEDCYQVCLHWSLMHDRLSVSNTAIRNAQGLSKINTPLLKQHGAVGDPISPLSFLEAGKKIVGMAFVASNLKLPYAKSQE